MNMEAQGTIVDHEYEIHEGRRKVAQGSKKWFRVANSYGVDIVPGADDILVLAMTVVIDRCSTRGNKALRLPVKRRKPFENRFQQKPDAE
jgi:uncharacterized protein YxjI